MLAHFRTMPVPAFPYLPILALANPVTARPRTHKVEVQTKVASSISTATPLRHGGTPMCVRLPKQGGHPAEANRLESDFRRQDDFPLPLNRQLELRVPIALLDHEQSDPVGCSVVQKGN